MNLGPRSLVAIGFAALACGAWGYSAYDSAILWPERIQREAIGEVIAGYGDLISREANFSYGEGFARWQYSAPAPHPRLLALCDGELSGCTFVRSRKVSEGADITVAFEKGVLTVEEWWS